MNEAQGSGIEYSSRNTASLAFQDLPTLNLTFNPERTQHKKHGPVATSSVNFNQLPNSYWPMFYMTRCCHD